MDNVPSTHNQQADAARIDNPPIYPEVNHPVTLPDHKADVSGEEGHGVWNDLGSSESLDRRLIEPEASRRRTIDNTDVTTTALVRRSTIEEPANNAPTNTLSLSPGVVQTPEQTPGIFSAIYKYFFDIFRNVGAFLQWPIIYLLVLVILYHMILSAHASLGHPLCINRSLSPWLRCEARYAKVETKMDVDHAPRYESSSLMLAASAGVAVRRFDVALTVKEQNNVFKDAMGERLGARIQAFQKSLDNGSHVILASLDRLDIPFENDERWEERAHALVQVLYRTQSDLNSMVFRVTGVANQSVHGFERSQPSLISRVAQYFQQTSTNEQAILFSDSFQPFLNFREERIRKEVCAMEELAQDIDQWIRLSMEYLHLLRQEVLQAESSHTKRFWLWSWIPGTTTGDYEAKHEAQMDALHTKSAVEHLENMVAEACGLRDIFLRMSSAFRSLVEEALAISGGTRLPSPQNEVATVKELLEEFRRE